MKQFFQAYQCAICSLPLDKVDNALKCVNNHCFDLAKEGYVNLIPANRKKSLNSGDNREMILARNAFLEKGYYDFLINAILDLNIYKSRQIKLLEIGCGSGYYLGKIAAKINPQEVYGSDVSKEAAKFCSKKYKDYSFSVNNSFRLCFKNAYFDILLSVFSPFENKEVERCLAEDGYFILVRPNKEHLKEIYSQTGIPEKEKSNVTFENLELQKTFDLEKIITISTTDLNLLIQMTPLVWKLPEHFVFSKTIPEITLSFRISLYRQAKAV